jgi:hypothetical protein
VLEGELTIEIDGALSVPGRSELLSLKSMRLHKIWDYGRKRATTIGINQTIEDDRAEWLWCTDTVFGGMSACATSLPRFLMPSKGA